MLTHLSIRNIVLIEALDLEFSSGLTVLTGETGAGKSILLDSLGLILGAKAETRLIRSGESEASVTASFELDIDHPIWLILHEAGIQADTNEMLIIRRMLSRDGKNKAFINDQNVTLNLLKQVGNITADIHGQFDTHKLLNDKTHLQLVDHFSNNEAERIVLRKAYQSYNETKKQLNDIFQRAEKAKQEEDYLNFVLAELNKLNPQLNEGDELEDKRQMLRNKTQIHDCLSQVNQHLSSENGVDTQLSYAIKMLYGLGEKITPSLKKVQERLETIQTEMSDILFEFHHIQSQEEGSDENLDDIEIRLMDLKDMARKHRCQVNELPTIKQEIEGKLALIHNLDEHIIRLQKELAEKKKLYLEQAQSIHDIRKKAAQTIDTAVMHELVPLKMERAIFETAVEILDDENHWNETGITKTYFQVATNKGSALGPLSKIASGGEMSRFMLALKVVLASADATPTLIFDEVDSGIGGPTADAVGKRLETLSKQKQVLVITHSPQVAARGDHHLKVQKQDINNQTFTNVKKLARHEKLDEVARMLSGETMSAEAKAAAEKLMTKQDAA